MTGTNAETERERDGAAPDHNDTHHENPDEPKAVFENSGFCPCCRSHTVFRAIRDWLRDYYVCSRCGSIPRQRHVQSVLDSQFPGWEELTIHESSPSHDFIARYAHDYTCSQYFPDVPLGSVHKGFRCEDLENLTFANESLDLFITQDVMEHVFYPDQAIREIHRVLKPGGAHVFTAPKHKGLLQTRCRARMSPSGDVEHLFKEEYHGSPVGDNRALVTFDYGCDFELLMSTWVGHSVETVQTLDRSRGLDAEFNEVFIIRKPPAFVQRKLDSMARELAARDDAMAEIKASTSWRATLRAATDRVRKLRV